MLLRGDDFEDALLFVTCGAHVEAVGRAMRQQAEQVGQAAQAAQVGPVVQAVRNTGDGRSSGEGGEGKGGPEVGVSESVSVASLLVPLVPPNDDSDESDADADANGAGDIDDTKDETAVPPPRTTVPPPTIPLRALLVATTRFVWPLLLEGSL